MSLGLLDLFVIGATAFTSAAVFWGLLFLTKKPDGSSQSSSQNHLKKVSFLLEAEAVIDATPQAIALLGLPPHKDLSRSDIIAVLENTFPTLSDELAQCQDKPIIVNACDGTSAWLELRPANGRIQLCLGAIEGTVETAAIDIREANEDAELLTLREMVNHAPVLMWRSDPTGRLVWANDAYLTANDACSDILGVTPTLPSSPLFKELEDVPAFGNSVCRTSLRFAMMTLLGGMRFRQLKQTQGPRNSRSTLTPLFAQSWRNGSSCKHLAKPLRSSRLAWLSSTDAGSLQPLTPHYLT